jgi:hypothetical protein
VAKALCPALAVAVEGHIQLLRRPPGDNQVGAFSYDAEKDLLQSSFVDGSARQLCTETPQVRPPMPSNPVLHRCHTGSLRHVRQLRREAR